MTFSVGELARYTLIIPIHVIDRYLFPTKY